MYIPRAFPKTLTNLLEKAVKICPVSSHTDQVLRTYANVQIRLAFRFSCMLIHRVDKFHAFSILII